MTLRRVCVLIVSAAVMAAGVATWVTSSTSASAFTLAPHYVAFGHRAVCSTGPTHSVQPAQRRNHLLSSNERVTPRRAV